LDDLIGTLTLLVSVISIFPLWYSSQLELPDKPIERNKLKWLVVGTSLFFLITVLLFQSLPFYSDYFFKRGENTHSKKIISEAINHYEHALYLKSDRSDVYFSLGNLYESIANYQLAQKNYELAIKNNNVPFEAYNNLARLYLKEGKYDDALDLLTLALRFNKTHRDNADINGQSFEERKGVIYKNIAWAYLGLEEFDAAFKNAKISHKALSEGKVQKEHRFIQCIVAIAAKELEKYDIARIAQRLCSEEVQNYHGPERVLERKARKSINP